MTEDEMVAWHHQLDGHGFGWTLGVDGGQGGLECCGSAAAKSLQSCPTLCDPRDSSPLGSPIPRILQARILEWVAISFSNTQQSKLTYS